jgi:hypothetical protein
MMQAEGAFSRSYAEARRKFLDAAAAAHLPVYSTQHPLPGRDGEPLALDVAIAGNPNAERVLMVSSGCHGVEGYCGSGVQVAALRDPQWAARLAAGDLAVLYLHALNPYGFSHIRRVTHENVDLNRNFSDYTQPLPVNEAYGALHALLLPAQWPPDDANRTAIADYIAERGVAQYQAAVSRGQHAFPQGLFFGGTAPTWSNGALRAVLRQHASGARQLAWIDIHTGLGPSGVGERIFACRNDPAALVRARAWWGGNGATPITSIYDGSSTSASLTGLMMNAAYEECPQAAFTSIAMEYGTLVITEMIEALRAEQWLQLHPEAPAEQARAIKQQMLDAFYVDTATWRTQIITQAEEAMVQAVDGLRG